MPSYTRFLTMISTSTIIMYGLMYLNTFSLDHVYFSETRAYMALYMGAVMTVVMLAFMWGMYKNTFANVGIILVATLVFAGSLFAVRSQNPIADVTWMKAMIPHHSIAILTSSRANLSDPRVQALANEIIEAQRREIDEMQRLIAELEGRTSPPGQ